MDAASALRWISGHRAANARALALMREEGPPTPAVSFAQAMELCDLVPAEGHPPFRERDVELTRAAWLKLWRTWAEKHDRRP